MFFQAYFGAHAEKSDPKAVESGNLLAFPSENRLMGSGKIQTSHQPYRPSSLSAQSFKSQG